MRHDLSAWWQVGLVLAPLFLLSALGVRGLQLSKRAALEDARAQCERLVAEISDRFHAGVAELDAKVSLPQSYSETPLPTPSDEPQELFRVAMSLPATDAAPRLRRLAETYPEARSESGLPLLPLVAWIELRNAATTAESEVCADKLARAAIEAQPSVLTPELLTRAMRLLEERGVKEPLSAWQDRWERDERIRAVLRRNDDRIATRQTPLWLEGESESWWMESDRDGNVRQLIPKSSLVSLARAVATTGGATLPDYALPGVTLGGVELLEPKRDRPLLARAERGSFAVSAFLSDVGKLYRQQMIQTLWLGALLVCALAAALAGFWVMRRSLARERLLGELKSNFVASVSHELRAPIASMRVMAENLETGVVRESGRRDEYHRLISEECRRLSSVIDNVLDFARIEQNRKTYHFAETDVSALVRDAIELFEPRATQRGQKIESQLETIEPPPVGDGIAIQQALINLLDNAIKFSPRGAIITVRLGQRAGAAEGRTAESPHLSDLSRGAPDWELSVSDSGAGIPRTEHARIFERFYRLGSELCRETQGAGIGLSIVEHIVKGHGGRIELESEPGAGAKFTLLFPHTPPESKGRD